MLLMHFGQGTTTNTIIGTNPGMQLGNARCRRRLTVGTLLQRTDAPFASKQILFSPTALKNDNKTCRSSSIRHTHKHNRRQEGSLRSKRTPRTMASAMTMRFSRNSNPELQKGVNKLDLAWLRSTHSSHCARAI